MDKFDLIVIGAGPGGYVAAIKGAQSNLKVALVEEKHLGGICLNWGCIPTKALLKSSEVKYMMDHAADYGLKCKGAEVDFNAVIKRSRGVATQLSQGIGHLMKKHKIHVEMGRGVLNGKAGENHKLEVTDPKTKKKTTLLAKNIIIATGARAKSIKGMEVDNKRVWDYKGALNPESQPKSLLVVGSGAIGMEFASFFNTIGTKVSVVELKERILPVEDCEISDFAHKSFTSQGMTIHTNAQVKGLKNTGKQVEVDLDTGKGGIKKEKFDAVLVAVGISANIENMGLDNIKTENGHIVVDGYCQTNVGGIYAIGDVAGAPWLAHKASHEGIMAVEHICGHKVVPMKTTNIPGCTYTSPQVASVGLTEELARKEYKDQIKVGIFPFIGNGKAIAIGKPEGMIKTIFHGKTGELLGAHMVGSDVTELIQGFVIAKSAELTEEEIMHTVFPHPTLSEMLHESTLAAFGKAIHM